MKGWNESGGRREEISRGRRRRGLDAIGGNEGDFALC